MNCAQHAQIAMYQRVDERFTKSAPVTVSISSLSDKGLSRLNSTFLILPLW
jgi:hypothetical protein